MKFTVNRIGSVRTALLFVSVYVGLSNGVRAQRTWIADSLLSETTGDVRHVRIILPERGDDTLRFPVLYLLHGYGGDHSNWTERTRLLHYLDSLRLNLVVVMPDADNSWYQNMLSGQRFTDFMHEELPKWLHTSYPADTSAQFIAGLSMGGYGSLYLGMSRPSRYIAIGSFSGAVVFPSSLPAEVSTLQGRASALSLYEAFGEGSHPNRSKGDLYRYADGNGAPQKPYIYLRHGIQDGFREFLPGHRKLTELLSSSEWPYEYHEVPGAHNWPFWDASIREYLIRLTAWLPQHR